MVMSLWEFLDKMNNHKLSKEVLYHGFSTIIAATFSLSNSVLLRYLLQNPECPIFTQIRRQQCGHFLFVICTVVCITSMEQSYSEANSSSDSQIPCLYGIQSFNFGSYPVPDESSPCLHTLFP